MQGGEGTYALELARGCRKLGHNVKVLCGNSIKTNADQHKIDEELLNTGIEVFRYDWINKDRLWFIKWKRLFLDFLNNHKNINHIFFANFTSCIVGHKLLNKIKLPYSITIHGDDIDYFFSNNFLSFRTWKSLVLINKKEGRKFFINAKKIICVSQYAKKNLLSKIKIKIDPIVIHHGIEINNIDKYQVKKDILLKRFNIKQDKQIIVYLARFGEKKGQDLLLNALANDDELCKKIHIIFIGDGQNLNKIKKICQKQNFNNISFTGELSRDSALKILSGCNISILLSENYNETFGLVLLEAMLFKKPVITLNHGGMIEVVKNGINGFVVERSEIANKINYLVDNQNDSVIMGLNGEKILKEEFTNDKMAAKTVDCIL